MADKGGTRKIVENLRERVSGEDIVRLQRFVEGDIGDVLRYWLDVGQGTEDDAPLAWESAPTTTQTPARAEILSGLMAQPQLASVNLLVQGGSALVVDTVTDPDARCYRFANTLGVQTLGQLTLTPNFSGMIRIDVVEFALAEPTITESTSREVQDAVTGIFAPQTVNKVSSADLQFRIRLGVDGGGMPAHQAGWCPIMVASVPNGATDWDAVTCWDVRPLLADYAAPTKQDRTLFVAEQSHLRVDTKESPGQARLRGVWTGRKRHRKVGGRLARTSPGTDTLVSGAPYVDLAAAANQEASTGTIGAADYIHVYLLFPFALPRWCRYTDAGAGFRRPRGVKGLLVASNLGANFVFGTYPLTPALHASYGLGTLTSVDSVCIACGYSSSGGYQDMLVEDGQSFLGTAGPVVTGVAVPNVGLDFTLTPNIHFPAVARRLRVSLTADITVGAGLAVVIDRTLVCYRGTSTADAAVGIVGGAGQVTNDSGGSLTRKAAWEAQIPVHYNYPPEGGGRLVRWACTTSAAATPLAGSMVVTGWDVGH